MEEQPKAERKIKGELIRGAFMLLFFVAARLVSVLVTLIALLQFLSALIARKPNDRAMLFGKGLSCYLAEIVLFLSYCTEKRPWPFSAWPEGKPEEPTGIGA